MIEVRCTCGEVYHADEKYMGRRLRCRCGEMVELLGEAEEPSQGRRRKTASPWGRLWQEEAQREEQQGKRSRRKRRRSRAAAGNGSGWLDKLGERLTIPTRFRTSRFAKRRRRSRSGEAHESAATKTPRRRLITRWLTWLAMGYAGLTLLVWLAIVVASESWLPATMYLYGPRWLLLLPGPLLALAALVLRRALLVPLAIAVVVVLLPIMGLKAGWVRGSVDDGAGKRVRVATINAGGTGLSTFGIPVLLLEQKPDIVAIQECSEVVVAYLQELSDWHHHDTPGLCLISRYPIRRASVLDRRAFEGAQNTGVGGSSQAVRYEIDAPGTTIHLANVHLETPRKGLQGLFSLDARSVAENRMLREVESEQIFYWLRPYAERLIVLGDFNMPVESAFYRSAWAGYQNAFDMAGSGFGMTKDNGWIQIRIDHVLSGTEWRPMRAWVGPDVGSDHRPMIADLKRVARS